MAGGIRQRLEGAAGDAGAVLAAPLVLVLSPVRHLRELTDFQPERLHTGTAIDVGPV
jgi:hypothetical protein